MAQVVSIQIRIEDNGSIAVIGNTEQALQKLGTAGEASMKKLSSGAEQANASLARMNSVGAPAVRWTQQLGTHATTSLDNVRLLSQEFGFRLPRAMESALSRMPQFTAALGSMSAGLLAVGAAEVFVRMGTEVYDLYERFVSIEAPMDKFYDTMRKTAELDFSNTRTLETTAERLGQATQSYAKLPEMAKQVQQGFLPALMQGDIYGAANSLAGAHNLSQMGADSGQQMFALTKQQADQTHQQALAQIDLNHALDGTLSRRQQIAAESQKQQQIAAENRLYNKRVEQAYGNPVPKSAGLQDQQLADDTARAAASQKTIELNGEENSAIMKARDAATQAGLQGEALYQAKQRDGVRELIAELQQQHLAEEIPERVKALNLQYDNERLERVRQLTDETQKQAEAAEASGLKGAGRIGAEERASLGDIDRAQTKATVNGHIDPTVLADFNQQRNTAQQIATQKETELEEQFTEHTKALIDERTEAQLNGFDRISAAAKREHDQLQKSFNDSWGGKNVYVPAGQRTQFDQANKAIDTSADAQRRDLTQKNAADDLQYAREAAQAEARVRQQGVMGWVAAYKEGVAEIQAQEDARLAKLQEDAQKEGLTWEEISQRQADIVRAANAQMAEQSLQLQHQIAGNLQQAFTNPAEFIKQKMEQMFFEIIAAWIVRTQMFQRYFGNTLGSMQPGASTNTGFGGGFGGIMGSVLGIAHGAPTGTAGVVHAGTMLPASYGAGSMTTSQVGTPAPSSYSGTFSPMGTISGVQDVSRSIAQIAGMGSGPAASSGSGALGMDPSLTDMNKIMFPGGSSGAMTSVAGAPTAAGALSSVGGFAAAGYGAYQGIEGVAKDFHTGGVNGALGGTMSGAEAGAAIGSIVPGLGTAVGAVAGAIIGLGTNVVGDILGESGKFAARDYYKQTLFPELEQIENGYNSGGGSDFLGAISQANSTAAQGMTYMTQKWGKDAAQWVDDNYLTKEKNKVLQDIMTLAGGGHQYTTRSAMQFHGGGSITGFGDLGTSSTEGFIHAQMGEHVIMPQPASAHGPFLSAINSGANAAQMAAMYLNASGGVRGMSPAASGGDTHIHVHTLDTKTMQGWLRNGGAKMINEAQNKHAQNYGGSGVG